MTRFLSWCCCVLLLAVGWTESVARLARVAVVLSVSGRAHLGKKDDLPSRQRELKILDGLSMGDVLVLESDAKVTVSVLKTGVRYQLTGPMHVDVNSPDPIAPGPRVVELPRQTARESIVTSQALDLTKFGGTSGRPATEPKVYVDEAGDPLLNLDMLQGTSLETKSLSVYFRQHPAKDWVKGTPTLIHNAANDDLIQVGGLSPEPDVTYEVRIGEPGPKEFHFLVVRIPESDLEALREVEAAAVDLPSNIELFSCYTKLHLYVKANRLVEKLRKTYPKAADWSELEAQLRSMRGGDQKRV